MERGKGQMGSVGLNNMAHTRRGLVLSGGAARGAYQAGALMALHEADLQFDVISATSIGTINAMAWNMDGVLKELDQHWLKNAGGFKPFDMSRLLQGSNPFQFHKTLEAIADVYRHRYPWGDERSEILVTLADYETNEPVVMSSRDEKLSQGERELFMKASTAILHIGSAPVEIQGRNYYDGGYNINVPLDPLLDYELDEIWVIPLSPVKGDVARTGRKSPLVSAAKNFITHPYAASLLNWYEQSIDPPDMQIGPAKKVIISPYRGGAADMFKPGVSLTFSIDNIRALLSGGYVDDAQAVEDYLASRCSVPPSQPRKLVEDLALSRTPRAMR